MCALSASELLRVWERGANQTAARRALLLLEAGFPETSSLALGEMSVGRRDDLLLQLRAATIGPHLESVVSCPECRETLELVFHTDELRHLPKTESATEKWHLLERDGCRVNFRLVQALDLVEVAALPDSKGGEKYLLERSVIGATKYGEPISAEELPETVMNEVIQRLAQADPQAQVELALSCPACALRWSEPFDIVLFFWSEIESMCVRLLREVHTLAAAYGWSESEVVSLSPTRRQFYLNLVAEGET